MNKKIMILGASILQMPAIDKAKELGLQVVVVDMNPDAVGFNVEGIEKEIISTIDTEKIIKAAKKHKIDAIMTLASDMPMQSIAKVAKVMGLVGITEQTALNATNKAVMRRCLKENNVPIPEYYKVTTRKEYQQAIEIFRSKGMKCIIKPVDNSGSRGVTLISDYQSLQTIDKTFKYSKFFSRNGDIMVEEYMEGPEVSVETLSVDGKCYVIQITDKLTTGAPYFVEMGHNEPSMLSEDIKKQIMEVASTAVKAIGIENGPSHTEIIVTQAGPKVVELGARLGGDNITTHLVPLSTGVNMVECCIRSALGEKPDFEKKINQASAIRYINTKCGKIVRITGLGEAEAIDGVKKINIVHNIGKKANEIKNSVDRLGFVIAQADTPEEAIHICEQAIERIRVEVE